VVYSRRSVNYRLFLIAVYIVPFRFRLALVVYLKKQALYHPRLPAGRGSASRASFLCKCFLSKSFGSLRPPTIFTSPSPANSERPHGQRTGQSPVFSFLEDPECPRVLAIVRWRLFVAFTIFFEDFRSSRFSSLFPHAFPFSYSRARFPAFSPSLRPSLSFPCLGATTCWGRLRTAVPPKTSCIRAWPSRTTLSPTTPIDVLQAVHSGD